MRSPGLAWWCCCLAVALVACNHDPVDGGDGGELPADLWPVGDGGGDDMKCASGLLCGTPAMCCSDGQDCVAGACVAACASGIL